MGGAKGVRRCGEDGYGKYGDGEEPSEVGPVDYGAEEDSWVGDEWDWLPYVLPEGLR